MSEKIQQDEASGFVLLDKPRGMTSFQSLYPVKKRFNTRRVGHAGTLDQEATGLMVVAVGKCTRLLDDLEAQSKLYSFTLHLGRTTDTLEWVGETIAEDAQGARTLTQVQAVLPQFTSDILQTPPKYSAIKIEGKRASDRVRAGQEIEMKARSIQIYQLEILEEHDESTQQISMRCHCSKGTYIRSLGRDIAEALGTVGCVSQIRRLAIGNLRVEQGQNPEQRDLLELQVANQMFPWPCIDVDEKQLADLRQGKCISPKSFPDFAMDTRLFAMHKSQAQCVLRRTERGLHPEVQLQ